VALSEEKALLRARLLGRAPLCAPVSDLERDLVLTRGSGGRVDLAMVVGMDALGQSLAIAVTTPLGGDVFNTSFGFDGLNALTEETTPMLVRERVRVGIVTLLRKEPRVSRVVDVKLVDQRLEMPSADASRRLDVRVVFETVTDDRLALSAGASGARTTHG
jgi:phage baseplate assembly protein W